ncbi:Crp/Fnr family transcriptional regulator [Silvibacterium acidisoli]|uniref:Crp/Fnr family transcriptional regulator n=1 Tax=Acidobacteriaceae bacterium ZG23-2 TaxID=2883246 RepID=UPI00406C8ABD
MSWSLEERLALIYPLSNVLIDALPDALKRKLTGQMTRVRLPLRAPLYEPNETPRHIHFITSGIASVVSTTLEGSTTEVTTLGREGIPQGVHLLGSVPVPTRCFMQIAGTALRMEYATMQRLFASEEEVRRVVLAYAQYQTALLGQIAGCNRLHSAEARLSRWLLMIQDRTANSLLRLTQEFLGEMIGSQRTTVSEVAGDLQARGLIEYSRGTIRILDRVGLENTVCECYSVTRKLIATLYRLTEQSLYPEDPSEVEG